MNPDPAKSASSSRMTNGTVSGLGKAKDNSPPSRMTNGTVSTKSGASTLSVQYSGGVETISVPGDVSVTALTSTADKLKEGEDVFVVAKAQRDGSFITTNIISISAGTAK